MDAGKSSNSKLERVRERFAEWRSGTMRARIPEELWAQAIEVARRDGVNATAQALGLDGGKLKRLLVAAEAGMTAVTSPRFVELARSPSVKTRDAVVELVGPHGATVRIQLQGADLRELVELSRELLGIA